MKLMFFTVVVAGMLLAGVSCERHAWDDTKKLHEKHGGHDADSEKAGHGEDAGHDKDAGHQEGGGEGH